MGISFLQAIDRGWSQVHVSQVPTPARRIATTECAARPRRLLSRRSFLRSTGAFAGAAAAARAFPFTEAVAAPASGTPRPIPGGFNLADFGGPDLLLHVFPPAPGLELNTITDFNGIIGATEIRGLGTDSDGMTRAFDVDMRFVKGTFVGSDGRYAEKTFGFI